MKRCGFMLTELIVSIAFISIISIIIINTAIFMKQLLNQNLNYQKELEDKVIIYKELGTNFSTKNITSIEKINNGYKINFSKDSVNGETYETSNTITLINNVLNIDGQTFESDENNTYNNIKWSKTTNSNSFFLKLTIEMDIYDTPSNIELYYLNDPFDTTSIGV